MPDLRVGIDYACFGHWEIASIEAGMHVDKAWQSEVYSANAHRIAKEVHDLNFRSQFAPFEHGDRFDMMVGSPPCVGFSNANPKAGPDHPANKNFANFFKDVAMVKPDHFVVEICEPVFTRGAKILDSAIKLISKAGYVVAYRVYNVEEHGSPSIRRRPYFFGSRTLEISTLLEALRLPKEKPMPSSAVLDSLKSKWDGYEPDNRMLMSKYLEDGKTLRNGPFRTLTDNKRYINPNSAAPTVTGFLVESVFHYSHAGTKYERLLAVPEVSALMGFPVDFKLSNPDKPLRHAVQYSKIIASGVQIDFTTKLLKRIVKCL